MSKLSDLIEALLAKTEQRSLAWEVNSDESIWVNVGKNTVEVSQGKANKNYLSISVMNNVGDVVDASTFVTTTKEGDMMLKLYRTAKRQALKTDEVLDDIINLLKG